MKTFPTATTSFLVRIEKQCSRWKTFALCTLLALHMNEAQKSRGMLSSMMPYYRLSLVLSAAREEEVQSIEFRQASQRDTAQDMAKDK